jgi:predicted Zn-dependent protease
MAGAGDNNGAVNALKNALNLPDLNPYERSTMYQMLGQYSYELDRAVEAQQYFENAISAGGLLPNEIGNIKVVIAQLMIGNGQYREGAQRLENYLNSGGQQKPQYIDLLVNAWVQAEDYNRALPWAEKWFNAARPKERKHFDLLNFLYNNLGMQGRQADIVKEMIGRWPEDKTLWDAWASMLANGGREQEAFEVTKMLYLGGALNDEADLLKVVLSTICHSKRLKSSSVK